MTSHMNFFNRMRFTPFCFLSSLFRCHCCVFLSLLFVFAVYRRNEFVHCALCILVLRFEFWKWHQQYTKCLFILLPPQGCYHLHHFRATEVSQFEHEPTIDVQFHRFHCPSLRPTQPTHHVWRRRWPDSHTS